MYTMQSEKGMSIPLAYFYYEMEDFKKALKMIEIALYVNVAKLVHSSQKSLVMKLLKKNSKL